MARPTKQQQEEKRNIKLNLFYEPNLKKPGAHEKQKEVLEAIDDGKRWVQLRCGRKFGKTKLLIGWLFEQALKTKLTCVYIAPSKVQAKNITWDDHIQKLLTHFKQAGLPYKTNENELSVSLPVIENGKVTFKGGGKVQLFGVENGDSLRGLSNWGGCACDEYDDWEDDIWPLIIRPNLAPHMAPAIIAGTPKGFGNLYRNEQSGLFTCFHFTSYDNPTLDPQELMDLEIEYKSMGMGYYRQEILAEYERPQGTVYEEWSTNNFKPVPYDPFLPLHLSIDFGVNDPTAIIWIQPNGNEFRIVDYYEASDGNVDHFVQVIRSKPYKKPDLVTGDAAGKARSITTNTAPIDEYAKHGIHVRTKDGLKIPDQIRITHKYIPSLYIDDKRGERLRDCILNYRYPTKPNSALNQSNEIPLHNEWSHGLRALEYYFANIDGSGLLNNQGRNISFHNKSLKKKWGIG